MTTWPFDALPPLSYDVILADPPWHFDLRSAAGEAKSPQAQYKTMSPDEIKTLPVSHLARGNALIMMWKNIRNIIDAAEIDSENIGHSRKPPDQYAMLENLCTASTRRVELFSRKSADGWDAWGNECGKFDGELQ
jgi:N6-adenosine-specific RNA methylase IME4